ncbi:MAG: ABC transporter ATP-binding protein [Planctomycetota bacterium]
MIEVQNLTRRFGPFVAVNDVSFSVGRGEVVGFLGPNGAGKTTTMRMLTGYLPPTSGSVRIGGHDVVRDSMAVRRTIGYLPEAVPLYREHRIEEMLAFQGRLHGMERSAIARRTDEILERVGLAERRRSPIASLSKGMRQRVGLAVAILPDPEVLILDEPTSGLDPVQRVEVRELIGEIAKERTVLVSSHILPEVEAVAQRVVILHRGEIAADGTREELVAELGGGAAVRVEAMVQDPEEAKRLLGSLPGVTEVRDQGRLGIHHTFEVASADDLREDVGALAASRGWPLRELSWKRPSLEELFSRIALDLGDAAPAPAAAPAADAPDAPAAPKLEVSLGVSQPEPAAKPAPTDEPKRQVYNLNPFELGGQRDLGEPKDACDE